MLGSCSHFVHLLWGGLQQQMIDGKLTSFVNFASTKVDKAALEWITKVVTVGGTLALSGVAVGGAVMLLACVIVFAVFAKRK